MSDPLTISRGINYLGVLGAKLRDLQGYRTLAHELIQNADDAEGASSMAFDVGWDALVVDNDGVFTDCGHAQEAVCAWRSDQGRGHLCDFHRFRDVGAGDKRREGDTTGAFGLGFIAVYQVTDAPELISAGRHWKVHEEAPEDERIQVCIDCGHCKGSDVPQTRFILPWAFRPDTALRNGLGVEAVRADAPERFLADLEQAVPVAMLFLKRLRRIELKSAGSLVRAFERLDEGSSTIVTNGRADEDQVWHIIQGDFDLGARMLRERHPGRIEDKRAALVKLAIAGSGSGTGLLCAYLPTEQSEGLPFHLNADFFPSNDRKRVIFGNDYQSDWNREAVRAAASGLADRIGTLPDLLGAERFWQLLARLREVAYGAGAERGEGVFGEFWRQVAPEIAKERVVFTSKGEWVTADKPCCLMQREEAAALGVLESLGIQIVHEDLRPYHNLLRGDPLRVPFLDMDRLCNALSDLGFTARTPAKDMPRGLDSSTAWGALWQEMVTLLTRQERFQKARAEALARLRSVAIAPGRDGAYWPPAEISLGDAPTVKLFEPLGAAFLADNPDFGPLSEACRRFDVAAATVFLEQIPGDILASAYAEGVLDLPGMLAWLDDRRGEIQADTSMAARLAALPIFPCASGLRPLHELALPGDFVDPIGVSELVTMNRAGGHVDLLRILGAQELTFPTFAKDVVPAALRASDLDLTKKRAVLDLLSGRLGEIKADSALQSALAELPLMECQDGVWCRPSDAYLDRRIVRDVLGADVPLMVSSAAGREALEDLHTWLGAEGRPRFRDVASHLLEISERPSPIEGMAHLEDIVAYLAEEHRQGRLDEGNIARLRSMSWLPAQGDGERLWRPDELYTVFREHLFHTQGRFLGLDRAIQQESAKFLKELGVQSDPETRLVVRHVLEMSRRPDTGLNPECYVFLNGADPREYASKLVEAHCLLVVKPDGQKVYVSPRTAYRGDHPFGHWRIRLERSWLAHTMLLDQLRVKEGPDWRDAAKVLVEVSREVVHNRLDEEGYGVIMACWRLLQQAVDAGEDSTSELEELRSLSVVPDPRRILQRPVDLFFEDRAELATRFWELLKNSVIQRTEGVWRAMGRAGVRPLSAAVSTILLEVEPLDAESPLAHRLSTRGPLIRRVAESIADVALRNSVATAIAEITGLEVLVSRNVLVQYRLKAYGRDVPSDPEKTVVFVDREGCTLYHTMADTRPPWAAIARELALALIPDTDPGGLASALNHVLSAETDAEAVLILDDLGFPRLVDDTSVPPPPTTGDTVPPPTTSGPPGNGTEPPEPPRGPTHSSTPTKARGIKRTGRFRTYVLPGEATTSEDEDDAQRRLDKQTEFAAVQFALKHEQQRGRVPREMQPGHEGYDIESGPESGDVSRYIEVKGTRREWDIAGVGLTKPEFDRARELGDQYWLYVVENALDDAPVLHEIRDPARRVNQYLFDDGWRNVADLESSEDDAFRLLGDTFYDPRDEPGEPENDTGE